MFAERTNWNLAPNRLSEALAAHLAAGKRLYDLSASNPTEVGFTVNAEALLHALQNPAALTYVPDPKGIVRARQAVAEYYADRGDEISAEDVILTASTSEAYSFVFRALCNPGDELLVPAPSYPLFGFLGGYSRCAAGALSADVRQRMADRFSLRLKERSRRGRAGSSLSIRIIRPDIM